MLRSEGQGTKEELRKRDLRAELEEKEQRHFASKEKSGAGSVIDTYRYPWLYVDHGSSVFQRACLSIANFQR